MVHLNCNKQTYITNLKILNQFFTDNLMGLFSHENIHAIKFFAIILANKSTFGTSKNTLSLGKNIHAYFCFLLLLSFRALSNISYLCTGIAVKRKEKPSPK